MESKMKKVLRGSNGIYATIHFTREEFEDIRKELGLSPQDIEANKPYEVVK